ncbi:MAG: hypothetical protein R6X25_09845, partial [Candidatus Krumholzibacteriia bacterium]
MRGRLRRREPAGTWPAVVAPSAVALAVVAPAIITLALAAGALPAAAGTELAGDWVDPVAAADLLEQLEAAGADISPEDYRRLGLLESGDDLEDDASTSRGIPLRGRAGWLAESRPDRSLLSQAVMRAESGSWRGALRGGGRRVDRTWTGYMTVTGGSGADPRPGSRVLVGGLGLSHGLGLVAAGPSDRAVLSAGADLVGAPRGLRPSLARGTGAVRLGAGLATARGGLGLELLAGTTAPAASAPVRRAYWARLVAATRPGRAPTRTPPDSVRSPEIGRRVEILFGSEDGRPAMSAAGRVGSAGAALAGELGLWRTGASAAWQSAAAVSGTLTRGAWRAQAQTAAARAAEAPPLGRRPASLPGWDGHGWAGSLQWRPAPTAGLALLGAAGAAREDRRAGAVVRVQRTTTLAAWCCATWRIPSRQGRCGWDTRPKPTSTRWSSHRTARGC